MERVGGRTLFGAQPEPCGISGVPFAGRTFAWARFELSVSADAVKVPSGASLSLGLAIPTQASLALSGWTPPRHYLPLIPAPQKFGGLQRKHDAEFATTATQAGIWIEVPGAAPGESHVSVKLAARRYHGQPPATLAQLDVPAGCVNGSEGAQLYMNVSARGASAGFRCGGGAASAAGKSPAVPHGLDWQDEGGCGDTTGEAVLRAQAMGAGNVSIGAVSVANTLRPGAAAGVAAPISDQSGTISWDIGRMGAWHQRGQPGAATGWDAGTEDGVLDVTKLPFAADPTGTQDSTLALQAAIDFAMDNYMSVWLPAGVYKVTDGLRAIQRQRMEVNGFAAHNSKNLFCATARYPCSSALA